MDPVQEAINAALDLRAQMDAKRSEMLAAAGALAQKVSELAQIEVDLGNAVDAINDQYNH